jgi:hypothetical protein
MLKDRRYCFFGRMNGFEFEVRRVWLTMGDPLRTPPTPLMLLKCTLCRGATMAEQGLLALSGRRSFGGESSKHSLNDMDEDGDDPSWESSPLPDERVAMLPECV